MRQIRNSVFETNSSSMHSLVVKKNSEYYTYEEINDCMWLHNGVWDIWNDDNITFGRSPFECLNTFEAKVRYAIASLCGWYRNAEEKFKEIEQLVTEIFPECYEIKLPKVWYYDDEDEDKDEKRVSYGGVDEDILTPFLENTGITLKEFLTNKKYVVIVDGDEYCIWNSLKDSGLVNTDEIEKEYK